MTTTLAIPVFAEHVAPRFCVADDVQVVEVAETEVPSLTLTVDPAAILAHLEFAELDADGDGDITMDDEGVSNPLLFGLESNLVYRYEIQ